MASKTFISHLVWRTAFLAGVLLTVLISCVTMKRIEGKDSKQLAACQAVRSQMKAFSEGGVPAETARAFAEAYGISAPDCAMALGTLEAAPDTIAFATITPPQPRATILLVHGYLDNSSTWRLLLPALLQRGFRLAFCDLPGLGLSSGKPADIDSFDSYLRAASTAFDAAHAIAPQAPLFLLGHSTGAGILADLLLHDPARRAKAAGAILVAPLLRSAHWTATRTGIALFGWFVKNVHVSRRVTTSNPEQISFMRQDPLQPDSLPTHWVTELNRWRKRMEASSSTCDIPLLLLEGDRDDVVDWRHNIPYYRSHFPQARHHLIPGAGHLLPTEADPYRTQLLQLLQDFLPNP